MKVVSSRHSERLLFHSLVDGEVGSGADTALGQSLKYNRCIESL